MKLNLFIAVVVGGLMWWALITFGIWVWSML
jgi:hypothetical protein